MHIFYHYMSIVIKSKGRFIFW